MAELSETNEWLIFYDDGRTPKFHWCRVREQTMGAAIRTAMLEKNIPEAAIWLCVLASQQWNAAAYLGALKGHTSVGQHSVSLTPPGRINA